MRSQVVLRWSNIGKWSLTVVLVAAAEVGEQSHERRVR